MNRVSRLWSLLRSCWICHTFWLHPSSDFKKLVVEMKNFRHVIHPIKKRMLFSNPVSNKIFVPTLSLFPPLLQANHELLLVQG